MKVNLVNESNTLVLVLHLGFVLVSELWLRNSSEVSNRYPSEGAVG